MGIGGRRRSRGRGSQRGAVAVEFALVLPIFLLLIFGAVQYGWYFFQAQEGSFGAREGARAAAVGTGSPSDLGTFINGKIASTDDVTTNLCYIERQTTPPGDTEYSVGDTLRVTVTFDPVNFGFPFLPFPGGDEIIQTAETRVENVPEGSGWDTPPFGTC